VVITHTVTTIATWLFLRHICCKHRQQAIDISYDNYQYRKVKTTELCRKLTKIYRKLNYRKLTQT